MQTKKDEVRTKILANALMLFAKNGYVKTSVAEIAKEAELSSGNVYRYFLTKDDLFKTLFPESLVAEIKRRLMDATSEAFGLEDVFATSKAKTYLETIESIFQWSYEHRAQVAFLLNRAKGTEYEGLREEISRLLERQALRYAETTFGIQEIPTDGRFVLKQIYSSFLTNVSQIHSDSKNEQQFRARLGQLRIYHLSGLSAFFKSWRT